MLSSNSRACSHLGKVEEQEQIANEVIERMRSFSVLVVP